MHLSEICNSIKEHIILWCDMLIDYFKKLVPKNSKINNISTNAISYLELLSI